jgi:hypothetical protein
MGSLLMMRKLHCVFNYSQLANACYMERIDLSAHGFYITPDLDFDWTTGKGNPFRYFTYGAAFAEVEIDTLTGDFHTRTANVFLDLGYSINPAIDVGQVPFLRHTLLSFSFIIKLHFYFLLYFILNCPDIITPLRRICKI